MGASDKAVEALGVGRLVRYWLSGSIGVATYVMLDGPAHGLNEVTASLVALPLGAVAYCVSRAFVFPVLALLTGGLARWSLGFDLSLVDSADSPPFFRGAWFMHEKDLDEARWWRASQENSGHAELRGWADEIHMAFAGAIAIVIADLFNPEDAHAAVAACTTLLILVGGFNTLRFRRRETLLYQEYLVSLRDKQARLEPSTKLRQISADERNARKKG